MSQSTHITERPQPSTIRHHTIRQQLEVIARLWPPDWPPEAPRRLLWYDGRTERELIITVIDTRAAAIR
jgi:hypothetical protein